MGGATAPVARALLRTAAAPRALSSRLLPRQHHQTLLQRRYAGGHGEHGHGHGHHTAGSMNESLGIGFYSFAAVIPTIAIFYVLSRPGEDGTQPALTRLIGKYNDWVTAGFAEANETQVKAMEQAAFDRILFETAPREQNYEPRCPEAVHIHAPRNISASQYVDLDAMKERYRRKQAQNEELKAQKRAQKAQKEQ